jgi:hypothetical protein
MILTVYADQVTSYQHYVFLCLKNPACMLLVSARNREEKGGGQIKRARDPAQPYLSRLEHFLNDHAVQDKGNIKSRQICMSLHLGGSYVESQVASRLVPER